MAYFDKDNFRKEAEAANYSKEAIDAYIAKIDAQDAAEKVTDGKGTRARDQQRAVNTSDKSNTARNPQGEGRKQQ